MTALALGLGAAGPLRALAADSVTAAASASAGGVTAAGPSAASGAAVGTAVEAAAAQMPALPPDETRQFTVTLGDYSDGMRVAEASYRLSHVDGRYRLETSAQATGLVALVYSGQLTQASEGRVGPNGLVPESYREKRGRRPERAIRFDWASHQMFGIGDPPEVPLPAGTQDRLSLAYQLGLLVRQDPRRGQPGARLELPLAAMRSIDLVTVTSAGPSNLRINGTTVPGVKFEIRGESHKDDRIDVWLSPAQSMLPLRIRFLDDSNKIVDQVQNLRRS